MKSSLSKFDRLIKTARRQAHKAKLTKADVKEAIAKARINVSQNSRSYQMLKKI